MVVTAAKEEQFEDSRHYPNFPKGFHVEAGNGEGERGSVFFHPKRDTVRGLGSLLSVLREAGRPRCWEWGV